MEREEAINKLKKLVGLNRLICDGGHNTNSSKAIGKWINQQNQDVHIVVGMMKDKDHQGFISNLNDKVKSITLVDIPNQEGSISKEEFKNKLSALKMEINLSPSIQDAVKLNAKHQNTICL